MNWGRTVGWLSTCVAFVIAAHLALDMRTEGGPRALRRNVLVPAAERADAFSISRKGESVIRLAGGAPWRIVVPFAAVADRQTVLRLADALAFSPVTDEMTDAELLRIGRTRTDFGLDDPRVVVTVDDGDGREVRVAFGTTTPAGDGVYATVGGADSVYVVASNVLEAVDLGVAALRRRKVLEFTIEDVVSIDVKGGPGRLVRLVSDGDAWRFSNAREGVASSACVRTFLTALAELDAASFVWPVGASNETAVASASLLAGYGLDPESAVTVSLKCVDGADRIVSFGRESGKGQVYALTQAESAIVTVPVAFRDLAAAGAATFVDTRLFPLEPAAVNAVSLDDGRLAVLLSRNADGLWRIDAPVSAQADQRTVQELVKRLTLLRTTDADADGVSVSVGTNAGPIAVSRKALLADRSFVDLRSLDILRVDPKEIRRLVATDAGKTPVAVVHDAEKGSWSTENSDVAATVDAEAVATLSKALDPFRAVRVVRLKVSASELGVFGLDKPFRTVAIDQMDEGSMRRNVLIGDVADGGRYATLGSSDAVFVISPECASALLVPLVK